jgi:hypothetical protein
MRLAAPVVEGVRSAATIKPSDVTDLLEARLWEGFGHSRQDIGIVGPALVVYFACCGGTPEEAANSTRAQFRPQRSDRIVLPGHRFVLARDVPLFELSRLKLSNYVSATDYDSGEDPLFKDGLGRPMTVGNIFGYFVSIGKRIGVDGYALPGRLRGAFLRWADDCSSERVRMYLRGKQVSSRRGLAPLPKPAFSAVKADLENAHPLAKLDRERLRAPGPVQREYPTPHFPAISRGAWADIAVARKGNTSLPAEVLRALQTAIKSGKTASETAAHYGLAYNTIHRYSKAPTDVPPKLGQPSFLKVMLGHAGAMPRATPQSLMNLLNDTYGAKLTIHNTADTARKHGLKLATQPRKTPWRLHEAALRERMVEGPPASLEDLVAWFAARGIKISHSGVEYALAQLGLDGYRLRTSKGSRARAAFEAAWPTIREWMIQDPNAPYYMLAARLENELKTVIQFQTLRVYINAKPDRPPHSPAYGKKRSSAKRKPSGVKTETQG